MCHNFIISDRGLLIFVGLMLSTEFGIDGINGSVYHPPMQGLISDICEPTCMYSSLSKSSQILHSSFNRNLAYA